MTYKDQNFEMYSGDDKDLSFVVYDASGGVASLPAGGSGVWLLYDDNNSASVVRKSTDDSSVVISASLVTVVVSGSDTNALKGRYPHELSFRASTGKVSTLATGTVTILSDLIA